MLTRAARVLTHVQDLLSNQSRWCREMWAMTYYGTSCSPTEGEAVRWCLGGAILKEGLQAGLSRSEAQDILAFVNDVSFERCGENVVTANDKLGWEEVMTLVKHAIAASVGTAR